MIDIMSGIGFMAVIVYGGSEIIAGNKTIGEFMTFFTSLGFMFSPLRRLGAISGLWQMAAAALLRKVFAGVLALINGLRGPPGRAVPA